MRNLREYFRPHSPEEAVEIKQRYGERAVYLAGGSDLLVHRPAEVEAAIDVRFTGLGYVRDDGDIIRIGGTALLRDVELSVETVAGGMLFASVRHTAPWLIRNAATLAGNVGNASPAADGVPALMVLGAQLVLFDGAETLVEVPEVMVGPHRTNLGDRLIREIRIPKWGARRRGAFIKLARSASDIAQVNVAVSFDVSDSVLSDVRIAAGAVAPTVIRLRETERLLEGRELDSGALQDVSRVVREEVRPISDWRASENYRRRMSGVLVTRALQQAVSA